MTKQKQVLETWTRLKTKLQKLTCLVKHKELIKEALEFHLLQTSSFLMGRVYGEQTWGLPTNWVITPLSEPVVSQFDHRGKLRGEWKEFYEKKRWKRIFSKISLENFNKFSSVFWNKKPRMKGLWESFGSC